MLPDMCNHFNDAKGKTKRSFSCTSQFGRAGLAAMTALVLIVGVRVWSSASSLVAEETPPLPKLDIKQSEFRSSFVQDRRIGRDPFFPNSKRWETPEPLPDVPTNQVAELPEGVVDWSLFELKGISLRPQGNLALINRYTFALGEEQEMKFPGNLILKVRCESIAQGSVTIRVKDETHELTREILK